MLNYAMVLHQSESRQALAAVEQEWEERLRQREAEFQRLKEESLKGADELQTEDYRVAELQQEVRRLEAGVQERLELQAKVLTKLYAPLMIKFGGFWSALGLWSALSTGA